MHTHGHLHASFGLSLLLVGPFGLLVVPFRLLLVGPFGLLMVPFGLLLVVPVGLFVVTRVLIGVVFPLRNVPNVMGLVRMGLNHLTLIVLIVDDFDNNFFDTFGFRKLVGDAVALTENSETPLEVLSRDGNLGARRDFHGEGCILSESLSVEGRQAL